MNLPFLQLNDCGVFIVSLIQSQHVWDGSNYTNVWIQFIYIMEYGRYMLEILRVIMYKVVD